MIRMRVILISFLLVSTTALGYLFWRAEVTPAVLKVGSNVWPGYEPLYLARDLGWYQDQPIRLIELRSASDVMQLLRSGALDAAALTLDESLTLLQDGYDLAVVLVMDISQGGDSLLAHSDIEILSQLRNKRVGVEISGIGAILLASALETAGVRSSEITIVPLTVDEHESAYLNGQVDALVTFEPLRSRLLEKGAHVLYDSSHIPGRIMDVLVVRRDLLRSRKQALKKLVSGYFLAVRYLTEHPLEAAKRMSGRLALAPGAIGKAYQGLHLLSAKENQAWLTGHPSRLEKTASQLATFLLQNHLLRNPVFIKTLTDARFLPGESS